MPDLAGWRIERMPPEELDRPAMRLAPDWLCEIASPSTRNLDRGRKMPIYQREKVGHLWIVDPSERLLDTDREPC